MSDQETLETGYGPDCPPGDTLCNDFQQETARSFAELGRARGDRVERLVGELTMTDANTPLPFHNRAVLEQPMTDVERTVGQLRAFYDAAGAGPFLLDSAWPTPDLRPHGFTLMGHPPLMVRAPDRALPEPPAELRIVRVEDAETAADLERTLIDGYPAPMLAPFERLRLFTPAALEAHGWHSFVGYLDERPVAVGSAYVDQQLLRVENIAALPDVRGRGFGLAITAATIAVEPAKPAALVASDFGRPIYERLGFVAMARVSYWIGVR